MRKFVLEYFITAELWMLVFASVLPVKSNGQELWGIANSNYAGIMGLELNPASFMLFPCRRELHLVSADIMLQNDYLYIPAGKSPFIKLVTMQGITRDDTKDHFTPPPKNAYGNMFLKLPSYAFRNDIRSWNFHVSVRSITSVRDVAYHFAKFMWEGSDYQPLHDIQRNTPPLKAATINFIEAGATYSRVLFNYGDNYIVGGVTGNVIGGMASLFVKGDNIDYYIDDDSTLIVQDIDASYGHSLPPDGNYSFINIIKPKGFGFSTSMGLIWVRGIDPFAYKRNANTLRKYKKYIWKAGISLVDIGYIKFRKNAGTFSFKDNETYWPGFDTTKFYNIDYADAMLSMRFRGNPTSSSQEKKYAMGLPFGASLQFDYGVTAVIYTNISLMQPLHFGFPAVRRAAQLAVIPRYETPRFEVSIPVSIYEYEKLRFGLGLRYGILVFGSDNLLPLTGLINADGFDLYFGIKWCLKDNGGGKTKKEEDCPAYK